MGEELIDRIAGVGGIILGSSENRSWIMILYEGDLMHTQNVPLPEEACLDILVEEIPHKTTVYEHPRTTIYFERPCTLEIVRDGSRIVVRGSAAEEGA
jgi:hypothetical protein